MKESLKETDLFKKYIKNIKDTYEKSDIKAKNWQYSLCSTPLFENSVVIAGFNWGVSKDHKPQEVCPTEKFRDNKDLGSLGRIKKYLQSYVEEADLDKIVQINLCFFRSKRESDLSNNDVTINNQLFISLIRDLQPKILLALSARIHNVIKGHLLSEETEILKSQNKTIEIRRGTFDEEFGGGQFAYIPHPNYPFSI
ncbi:MAG: hypothetical protein NVS9B7_05330 [Flavisolibacter sp.]